MELASDEVHVWRARLDQEGPLVHNLLQTLSADERSRAAQFHFDQDRERFVTARGQLRHILSRYLHMDANQLRFCYSPYGKPSLVMMHEKGRLSFSVSHSCRLALYAVARGRRVGIDLERIRVDFEYEEIAKRFFAPGENGVLHSLPAGEKKAKAFFDCWVRKEAYVKARGEGLSLPLNRFDVSLAPGEPAKMLRNRRDPQEVSRWSLQEIVLNAGFAAALAVEGHNGRLTCWECPDSEHESDHDVVSFGESRCLSIGRTSAAE